MKYSLISKYRSSIMGVAAIIIVIMHYFVELYPSLLPSAVETLIKRGNIGTDVFLFVSGMGLFFSMSKDNRPKEFYLKRIRRVILPTLLISLPYWFILGMLISGDSFGMFLLNWTGISLWTHGIRVIWYVSLIVVLYLFYPLIYKLQKRNTYMLFVVMAAIYAAIVILFVCCPSYYDKIEIAVTRIPVFLIGSMFGEAVFCGGEKKRKINIIVTVYMIIMLVLMLIGIVFQSKDHDLSVMLYRIGSGGAAVLLCLIVPAVLEGFKLGKINNALVKVGAISLELYLIHVFIKNTISKMGWGNSSGSAVKLMIIAVAVTLAVILSFAVSYLESRFINKKQQSS